VDLSFVGDRRFHECLDAALPSLSNVGPVGEWPRDRSLKSRPRSASLDRLSRSPPYLTEIAQRGLALFEGKALCSACQPNAGLQALFTDFTYDNTGKRITPFDARSYMLHGALKSLEQVVRYPDAPGPISSHVRARTEG